MSRLFDLLFNRGRSYWHGWCNAARDRGGWEQTAVSRQLAREYLAKARAQ